MTPQTEFDGRYSDPAAVATPWEQARARLADAPLYWISTVRPGGRRPHVTPLIGVWVDETLHFTTGAGERKARNLAETPGCVLTTGSNEWDSGLDVVLEGDARRVTDPLRLHGIAAAYVDKYGEGWRFEVDESAGALLGDGGAALVFGVQADTAFAFAKGVFAQTRYRW